MLGLVLQFAFLAAMIVVAGAIMTRSADVLGEALGLGRTIAGMLLLAAATSLPELAIDCKAASIGAPDLAVGDLFGSSLFNLLILGVLDLVHRSRHRIFSRVSAAHALSATVSIALTALALLFIILPGSMRFDLLGVGVGSIVIVATYLASLRLIYADQREAAKAGGEVEEKAKESRPLRWHVAAYLATLAVIFIAAQFLAPTAEELANRSGLGGTFVGTSLVALTTSLPELVTTWTAVRMGAIDMAVGNILGSNAFNMTILLPVDIFYRGGSVLAAVDKTHAITAVAVIVITCVVTVSMLYRAEKRYWLVEPDAALVVLLVLGALGMVYWAGQSGAS